VNLAPFVRSAALALSLGVAADCASHAPPIRDAARIRAFCGSMQARQTGIDSVISSTDDRLLDEHPTDAEVMRSVGTADGVVAYWNAQPLALPRVSVALGETDGYVRVDAAAIPPSPDATVSRRIYLLVRDRGVKRWIAMNAYDVQSVCVEGRKDV
jgi:hypothetical protein